MTFFPKNKTTFALVCCSFLFFALQLQASPLFHIPSTPAAVKNDAGSAYHFGKWVADSTNKTPAQAGAEARGALRMAIENDIDDYEHGIINEDYPNLTFDDLKKAAIADANSEVKCYQDPSTPPPLGTGHDPGSIVQTPMGRRGLSNHSGVCFFITALQILKTTLQPLAQIAPDSGAVSFPTCPDLNKSIAYLPNLQKFLRNEIVDDEGSRALFKEMAQFIDWRMIQRPWNTNFNGDSDNAYVGETGSGIEVGGDPSEFLRAWSYEFYLPAMMEEGVPTSLEAKEEKYFSAGKKYIYTNHLRKLFIPELEEKENLHFKSPSLQKIITDDLSARGRNIMDVLPPVVSYTLLRSEEVQLTPKSYDNNLVPCGGFTSIAEKILDPVTLSLPSQDASLPSTTAILRPIEVSVNICTFNSGHAFTFIQENGSWYELNNNNVFPIPQAWEEDLKFYISRYVGKIIISYATNNNQDGYIFSAAGIAAPSSAQAAALDAQLKTQSNKEESMNYTFYYWALYKHHPELLNTANSSTAPAAQ